MPEKAVATGRQVAAFLNQTDPTCSGKAKLAYINGCGYSGELHYVDYSETAGVPTVRTIEGVSDARVPVISPDGEWVVYAVGDGAEGHLGAGASTAYICRLAPSASPVKVADNAHEPRFVLNQTDPNVMTVIYGTVGGQKAWTKDDPGKTMKVAITVSGGTPHVGTPEVVFEWASMMGGLSWDERYLATAGGLGAMADLQGGKTTVDTVSLRFARRPVNADWPAGMTADMVLAASQAAGMDLLGQTCNPSISSSRARYTNAMMALDFGSSKVNGNYHDGKPWGKWQILWVFDIAGAVRYHFPVPRNDPAYPYEQGWPIDFDNLDTAIHLAETRWHHTEWSNHPYFATGAVILRRGWGWDTAATTPKIERNFRATVRQERLYLMDLDNSRYLCLLSPTDEGIRYHEEKLAQYSYPSLWVEVSRQFTEREGWLSEENNPVDRAQGSRRSRRMVSLTGSRLISRYPIETVTVYAPNGAVVKRVSPKRERTLDLESLVSLPAGTFFVRVWTQAGATILCYGAVP